MLGMLVDWNFASSPSMHSKGMRWPISDYEFVDSHCISPRNSLFISRFALKMCCNVPIAQKAQPMPTDANFPPGWKYVIDETRTTYKQNDFLAPPMKGAYGLKILAPVGSEYYSVELAKKSNKALLKEVSADAFYEYIGAPKRRSLPSASLPFVNATVFPKKSQETSSSKAPKRALADSASGCGPSKASPFSKGNDDYSAVSLSELSNYRVVGSRVCCLTCCLTEIEEKWGTVTEKTKIKHNEYSFTVSPQTVGAARTYALATNTSDFFSCIRSNSMMDRCYRTSTRIQFFQKGATSKRLEKILLYP